LRAVEHFLPLAAVTRSMTALRLHPWGGGMSLVYPVIAMLLIIAAALVAAASLIQRRTA
jgi:hypothetical protein